MMATGIKNFYFFHIFIFYHFLDQKFQLNFKSHEFFIILTLIYSKIVIYTAKRLDDSNTLKEAVRCATKIEEVGLKILKSRL